MHILIIPSDPFIPDYDQLAGIFQYDQAIALKKAGIKVGGISIELSSILSVFEVTSQRPISNQVLNKNEIPILRQKGLFWIPLFRQFYIWQWVYSGMKLFKKYSQDFGTPDIVHAHNALRAGILAQEIKQKFNIPYVITEHSSSFARGLIYKSEIQFITKAYREADRCLVVSPNLGFLLEDYFRGTFPPWECIPNILDMRFEQDLEPYNLSSANRNRFRFLNIGSPIKLKGQVELLEAFAKKFKNIPNIELRIISSRPSGKELESFAAKLGITAQVSFGEQLTRNEVMHEMIACDVYVHPSQYETFGVSIIEALACGKPVIATKCGGPESIINESNGILVSVKDIEGLGRAMVDVMANIHQYDQHIIRKNCISRFGVKEITSKLVKIYSEIYSNKKFKAI